MKEQFITKWSNWWQFNKNAKQLNEAFKRELNEVIENEIALRPHTKIAFTEEERKIFDHIPTLAELGIEEDVEFPCEMEVKVWDADIFTKRIVVAKFNDDGKDYFIAKNPSALTGFSIHTTAKPIRTEQLTISELLTIASEVKGVQVTLKEDKA